MNLRLKEEKQSDYKPQKYTVISNYFSNKQIELNVFLCMWTKPSFPLEKCNFQANRLIEVTNLSINLAFIKLIIVCLRLWALMIISSHLRSLLDKYLMQEEAKQKHARNPKRWFKQIRILTLKQIWLAIHTTCTARVKIIFKRHYSINVRTWQYSKRAVAFLLLRNYHN